MGIILKIEYFFFNFMNIIILVTSYKIRYVRLHNLDKGRTLSVLYRGT